jgi:hypothetical protein
MRWWLQRVTGRDWKIPELITRYGLQHFSPYLVRRIQSLSSPSVECKVQLVPSRRLVLVRHAAAAGDVNTPRSEWSLSPVGRAFATQLASSLSELDVGLILSSAGEIEGSVV